jgi:hypothetical protein
MRNVTTVQRAGGLLVALLFGLSSACSDGSKTTYDAGGNPSTGVDAGDGDGLGDGDSPGDGDHTKPDGSVNSDGGMVEDGGRRPDAGDGDGDGGKPAQCQPLAPLDGDAPCALEGEGDQLLIRATILSPEGPLEGGEVLVGSDGKIACVGCNCAPTTGTARTLTCPEAVVSPGLINGHDHLGWDHQPPAKVTESYDHRHDWRKGLRNHKKVTTGDSGNAANAVWSELRQLMVGTTSIAGSNFGKGLLRNLDQTSESGLTGQDELTYQTFPLGDGSSGQLLTDSCAYTGMMDASKYATGCRMLHVSEGIDREARNEFLCLSSAAGGGVNTTGMGASFVHAIGLLPGDGQRLADSKTAVIWSPRSNIALYGNTAQVTMYRRQGVTIALGTDWTPSGSSTIIRELACAESLSKTYFDGAFSERDLFNMVTREAAKAFEVDDVVGALEQGLVGDIVLYKRGAGSAYRAVFDASAGSTLLVLKGGAPIYGNAELLTGLMGTTPNCETLPDPVCGVQKSICLSGSTGGTYTYATLLAANKTSYGLVFCDAPADEPSCLPKRDGEYTGASTDTDTDGDGVLNTADNCPRVFNPARPVDHHVQSDVDGDGLGDVCDPCPLQAGVDVCMMTLANDRDGDGATDDKDNCPVDYNANQADGDHDNIGDLCDACPAQANAPGAACSATIYQVKLTQAPATVGHTVQVPGVVTGIASTGFFIQVPEADRPTADAVDNSGLFVYLGANPNSLRIPARGDALLVTGAVQNYFSQIELNNVSAIELVATGRPMPAPVAVVPADIATGGARAAALEGALVRVNDVTVTNVAPALGGGDHAPSNEFIVDEKLRIDDFMFLIAPFPVLHDEFTSVTGLLRRANDDSKLEPRDTNDVVRPVRLTGVSASDTFLNEGDAKASANPVVKVQLNQLAPAGGTAITLVSDSASVVVPASVTVLEGQKEAEILFSAPSVPANGKATVTASLGADSYPIVVHVVGASVQPELAGVDPSTLDLAIGVQGQVTVSLKTPAPAGGVTLDVAVQGDAVHAPATVLVAEGDLSAPLLIDGVAEGNAKVTVALGAVSFDVEVAVAAKPALGLVLSEVLYNPAGIDDKQEWVEIYNGTNDSIDLSGYALAWGGTDYKYGQLQLTGTLEKGGCFVVGGPTADPTKPAYDQAMDFNPDIQNSGTAAAEPGDGVALFKGLASAIKSGALTVPVDAVVYGKNNTSGLLGPDGNPVPVTALGPVVNGQSIERHAGGWAAQATPTLKNCQALFAN